MVGRPLARGLSADAPVFEQNICSGAVIR